MLILRSCVDKHPLTVSNYCGPIIFFRFTFNNSILEYFFNTFVQVFPTMLFNNASLNTTRYTRLKLMNSCAHSVRPIHLNFATCQPAKVSKYFRWMSDVFNGQFNDICNWVIKTFSLSDSAQAISSRISG